MRVSGSIGETKFGKHEYKIIYGAPKSDVWAAHRVIMTK